jgi:hypothetical protein
MQHSPGQAYHLTPASIANVGEAGGGQRRGNDGLDPPLGTVVQRSLTK